MFPRYNIGGRKDKNYGASVSDGDLFPSIRWVSGNQKSSTPTDCGRTGLVLLQTVTGTMFITF
jgi:hypothetical protein